MIYTLTLNPALDYIVSVDNFRPGRTNRTSSELLLAGGKGINVSTVLKNLGMESIALGFTAGFSGEEIIRKLDSVGIQNNFIKIEDGFSRINLKIKNMEGTEINGQGPVIREEKVQQLMKQLEELQGGDVLFLSGSIPASISDDIYAKIMERLAGRYIYIVADATKDLLMKTLPYRPFLIKPNHHELGEIFGVEINSRQEAIPYAKKLREMGAVNVLVSLAGEGAVLVDENGSIYETSAPRCEVKNAVGAGDSMLAGFMTGYLKQKEYEYAFYMGVVAGSAGAFSEQFAAKEEVESLYQQIAKQNNIKLKQEGNL